MKKEEQNTKALDEVDRDVYRFIIDFAVENQYIPSVDEIAEGIFWSNITVRKHLKNLEECGYLINKSVRGTHRRYIVKGLKITKRGKGI